MNFSERFHARHARKADDVVGFQTGQCCRGHFRKGGVARVVHHDNATALLECRQDGRAVTQRSREDGADCSGTTAEASRSEYRIEGWPGGG
jgi:hypothetical protein